MDGSELVLLEVQFILFGYFLSMFVALSCHIDIPSSSSFVGLLALNWVMICKVSLIRNQLRLAREGQLERYKIRFKVIFYCYQ